jgi:hypothetical protein
VSKALPLHLSSARLHAFIQPDLGSCALAILQFAQREPSVQSIAGIIIVIGLAPL